MIATPSWPELCRTVAAVMLSAAAMATVPACAGTWVMDAVSRCQVWNPNPQLDESVNWSGSCTKGRAEGRGVAQWFKGTLKYETDEGEWHDGRQVNAGKQSWSNGRYDGELADSEPNGHGVLTVQKLRYEGEFHDGRPNGFGTLTAGTKTVQGNWKDGCLQGTRKASIGVPLSACR